MTQKNFHSIVSYHVVAALFIILICGAAVTAQAQLNGSSYSRFGIGDLLYFPNSRSAGMGGAGAAMLPLNTIDAFNPANWTRISMTRYSVGGMYRRIGTADQNTSAAYGTTVFNGVSLALPVVPAHGVVAAFTLSPYSNVGYAIITPASQGGFTYDLQYQGEGGISKAQIGLSANVGAALNLGISYNYYFGTIRHNISQTVTSGSYANSSALREVQLKGSGVTLGLVYAGLGNALQLPAASSLNIGGFVSTATYLSADEERRTTSASGGTTTYDTLGFKTYNLKIPLRFGIGLAYTADRLTLASDIAMQNWDDARYPGVLSATVRNSYRWSFGGELTAKREQNTPFFQRFAYRAGTYYTATYYVINNQPINEIGFTGGFGIPVLGETRLDITGEYGMRGTTDFGLQKDNIFRFSFTLTGGEPWFVRPAEE